MMNHGVSVRLHHARELAQVDHIDLRNHFEIANARRDLQSSLRRNVHQNDARWLRRNASDQERLRHIEHRVPCCAERLRQLRSFRRRVAHENERCVVQNALAPPIAFLLASAHVAPTQTLA